MLESCRFISHRWLFTAILLAFCACSSPEKKDPDEGLALTDNGDGNLTSEKEKPAKNQTDEDSGDDDSQSSDKKDEDAPKKVTASNDYDDNWNDINSEPPPPKPEENNSQNASSGNQEFEEPPLPNAQTQEVNNTPVVNTPVDDVPMNAEPAMEFEPVAQETPKPQPGAPLISGPPLVKNEVLPQMAQLWWVGYDFDERHGLIRIELVTRGSPRYNIFQERNQADQAELVIRYFQTELRRKVRRDIDASEFRSPVAFVRMRPDTEESTVDVVITLRDPVRPRMFTQNGNILLTFPIPDHYFGNSTIGDAPIAKAEMLPNSNIMPEIDNSSEIPEGLKLAQAFVPDYAAQAFASAPADGGEPIAAGEAGAEAAATPGMPEDFQAVDAPMVDMQSEANPGNTPANPNANMFSEGGEKFNYYSNPQNSGQNFDPESLNESASPQGTESQGDDGQDVDDGLDNGLDNFDGDGEFKKDIDKFDVRLREESDYIVTAFSIAAVAQDNLDSLEGDLSQNGNMPANGGMPPISDNFSLGNEGNSGNPSGGTGATNSGSGSGSGSGNVGIGNSNIADEVFSNAGTGNAPANSPAMNPDVANSMSNPTANSLMMNPAAANVPANMTGSGNMAPVPAVVEPILDGAPDLSGAETVGSDVEVPPPPSSGGGRPIKLDFRGAPLTEVIRALSAESGINFVFPPDIGVKQVFVNLMGVSFNDALKAVLEAHALGMVELGPNVVRIDSLERLAKDKEIAERRRQAELKLRPTKVLVHRLSYTKAEDAAKMLLEMLAFSQKEDGRIAVQTDMRTNSVIVNAPAIDLAMVKALLERIDLETPQVKISSRIVEVNKTQGDSFGISWGTPFRFDQGRGLGFGNLVFPNYMVSRYSVDAGGLVDRPGNFQFRFGSINDSLMLDLALSMEETRSTLEILQSNNIVVEDNVEAQIVAGRSDFLRRQNQIVGGQQMDGGLDEITYNLTMKVQPHVTADGAVQMKVTIESDDPGPSSSDQAAAAKNNRSITTSLLRKSGETVVIGGIYNTNRRHNVTGIPFLSRLPIVGALFRSTTSGEDKRELLVMVTPTILNSTKTFEGDSAASSVNMAGELNSGMTASQNAGFGLSQNGALSQNSQNANFNTSQQNAGLNNSSQDFSQDNAQSEESLEGLNGQTSNTSNANAQQQEE